MVDDLVLQEQLARLRGSWSNELEQLQSRAADKVSAEVRTSGASTAAVDPLWLALRQDELLRGEYATDRRDQEQLHALRVILREHRRYEGGGRCGAGVITSIGTMTTGSSLVQASPRQRLAFLGMWYVNRDQSSECRSLARGSESTRPRQPARRAGWAQRGKCSCFSQLTQKNET